MKSKINKLLPKLIDELEKLQNNDGSFFSNTSALKNKFDPKTKYKTIFHSALILNCLSEIKNKKAKIIRDRIVKFLKSEKNKDWSFNYWAKETSEFKRYRVPNDMDDTFVVLSGIYRNDENAFGPKDLAKITKVLVEYEVVEGGPYQTWHISNPNDNKWLDVDIAVNANIGYFLHLMDIELPNMNKLFAEAIRKNKLKSIFYSNEFSTIYYLSRFYKNDKEKLIKLILKKKDKQDSFENILITSMMISSLINLGYEKEKVGRIGEKFVNTINLDKQNIFAFCLDPAIDGKNYYSGSKALTLAMVTEALEKLSSYKKIVKIKNKDVESELFIKKVINKFEEDNKNLKNPLKKIMSSFLQIILKKDKNNEIILMPYEFYKSMKTKSDLELVEKLSLANLYGWIAYTIYDDFLDDEGKIYLLPVANICLKRLVQIFSIISVEYDIKNLNKIFDELMEQMEWANCEEVSNYRINSNQLKTKKDLPRRINLDISCFKSLPHALGPITILLDNNCREKILKKFISAFQNYLIAKQINDDAHDFFDDLQRGIINPAGHMMMLDYFEKYKTFDINKKVDVDRAKYIYWTNTIHKLTDIIIEHSNISIKQLKAINTIGEIDYLKRKLTNLKSVANHAITESIDSAKFIEEFK